MNASSAKPLSDAARAQLAPEGRLKVGIAVGPAASAMWTARDPATGKPHGVTVDLGGAMAKTFGLELELVEHDSSGEIIKAADSGRWTVAFTPVDAERKLKVDFGPNYFLGESTYMVRGDSPIRTLADVDQPGVKVLGVEGTATLRSARRTLSTTEALGVTGLDEALELFLARKVDAIALGRESLVSLLPRIPDGRILDGAFHSAGTAVAVPRGNAEALAAVTAFIEQAKTDGTLRAIFDRNGLDDSAVAPVGSMP